MAGIGVHDSGTGVHDQRNTQKSFWKDVNQFYAQYTRQQRMTLEAQG